VSEQYIKKVGNYVYFTINENEQTSLDTVFISDEQIKSEPIDDAVETPVVVEATPELVQSEPEVVEEATEEIEEKVIELPEIFAWRILDIYAEGELITHVRYHASIGKVETEGNWYFREPQFNTPLANVTEEMLIEWIEKEAIQDGVNPIKSRLEEQLKAIQPEKIYPPWKPKVFSVSV
jgi:hypothetical protein